jgi:hypothetical protein
MPVFHWMKGIDAERRARVVEFGASFCHFTVKVAGADWRARVGLSSLHDPLERSCQCVHAVVKSLKANSGGAITSTAWEIVLKILKPVCDL